MTFVFLKDKFNSWWKWDKPLMKLCNFKGGGFDIDENANYWMTAEIFEFENWHELYLSKNYNPLETDVYAFDVWLSPEGIFFDGDGHQLQAEYICDLVYNMKFDTLDYSDAEDYLIEHGWKKVTASAMWPYYCKDLNWKLTYKQYGALKNYCQIHNLKFPSNACILRSF